MDKISIIKLSMALALVVPALSSCDSDVFNVNADPFAGTVYKSKEKLPIADIVDADENLSEYAKALRYSDTYDALNQCTSGVTFTAFVPNNDAMKEFYSRRGVSSLEELDPDYVRSFVLYHTLKGGTSKEVFITQASATNLCDEIFNIEIDDQHAGEASIGDLGQIIEMGDSAYNGFVYIMSRAMTPLVETVFDRLAQDPSCSIMTQAVEAAGWKKDLSTVADTVVVVGSKTVTRRYYSFFSVSDATFRAKGINSVSDLTSRLLADDDRGLDSDSLLREYVAYHVLEGNFNLDNFGNADTESTTRIYSTSAKGQVFSLTVNVDAASASDRNVLNKEGDKASFVESSSDIIAKNGVVHTLDSYLPVWRPDATEVVWDLCENAAIAAIVGPENYQPSAEVAKNAFSCSLTNASCIEVEPSSSGTSNKGFSAVAYKAQPDITVMDFNTWTEYTVSCNNRDLLVLNVGFGGKVRIVTPTIIAGKYKVYMSVYQNADLEFITNKNNGGKVDVTFDSRDDVRNSSVCPYSFCTANGVTEVEIIPEVNFDVTDTHVFEITMKDREASSNSKFSFQIDTIRFEPIP